jgi:hypothetical protein
MRKVTRKITQIPKIFQLWSVTLKNGRVHYCAVPSCTFGDLQTAFSQLGLTFEQINCFTLVSVQCNVFEDSKERETK